METRPAMGSANLPAITAIASPAEPPNVERPSPFADRQDDRQQRGPAPAPQRREHADAVQQPPKPFELASIAPKNRIVALPPPPPLHNVAAGQSSLAVFGGGACCMGTATAEPAKPARLDRVLQKIPGLRRIHRSPDGDGGYVAARPAHRILLMLPPESRAALGDGTMDLKATVNESGAVTRVELLSPKNEELVRLAAYAASDWRFVPARSNDKTVPSEVILHFSF